LCYSISIYVAPWLRAVCIFCVFYSVEYVVAAWRCSWALLEWSWGGRGDVVVVGRSGVLWVVGSSWWFSAFSTAAVGCGAALPQVPLSLGSSRDWGGEWTEPLGGSAGAWVGDRRKLFGASSRRGPRRQGPRICRDGPHYLKPEAHLKSRGQLTARPAPRQNGASEAGVLELRRCG